MTNWRRLARVLSGLHRELHAAYKPDENARSNATRIYRLIRRPTMPARPRDLSDDEGAS